MAAKTKNSADRAVHGQYEAYPYPPRDPADEAKRLITGLPSSLVKIEHYVVGGRIPDAGPFRALIAGNMKVHICYHVPDKPARAVPLLPRSPGAVPVLNNVSPKALAGRLTGAPAISLDFDGVKMRLALPAQAPAITALVDGERSLPEIHRYLGKAGQKISPAGFARQFDTLYAVLNGINAMLLR